MKVLSALCRDMIKNLKIEEKMESQSFCMSMIMKENGNKLYIFVIYTNNVCINYIYNIYKMW